MKSTYCTWTQELTWPPLVFKQNERTKQDNDRWTAIEGKKKSRKGWVISKGRGQGRGFTQEKKMLTKEGKIGFILTQKPYCFILWQEENISDCSGASCCSVIATLRSTFRPQRALSAAGGVSPPSWVACWWIRPWWCSWSHFPLSHHCHNLVKDGWYRFPLSNRNMGWMTT